MLRILLVDDEMDILELMEEEFRSQNFETIIKTSGNKAAAFLEEESVDVVVSDYKMPDGSGQVVLEAVQKIPKEMRPLFYFVSGQADISIQEAMNSGIQGFYSKPFDIDDLIGEINGHLKTARPD